MRHLYNKPNKKYGKAWRSQKLGMRQTHAPLQSYRHARPFADVRNKICE